MSRRGSIGLWAAVCLLAACGQPTVETAREPVVVRATVASGDVRPGQQFALTVEIDRHKDARFELPPMAPRVEGLAVVSDRFEPPEPAGDRVLEREVLMLRAPLAGTYRVAPASAPWTLGERTGTAGTGEILVVASLEDSADTELRPLHPARAPEPDRRWMVAAAALPLLLAPLLLLRRRRQAPPPPPRPADEIALEALDALVLSGDLAARHAAAWALSMIVRRYLEARYSVRAAKMTTPEFLRALPPELSADRTLEPLVRQLLQASDEVKYAGTAVTEAVLRGWVDDARRLVTSTRPEAP